MRLLYLIRHGQPLLPDGGHVCLGVTDAPLSPLGRLQACLLGEALGDRARTVFSSPLSRALETARFLTPEPVVLPGLREYSTGDWDGLPFSEIRARWPEVYAARGEDPTVPIPNAEDYGAGQRRFHAAVREALAGSEGDIAVVAHAGVMGALLSDLFGSRAYDDHRYRPPYCGWYVLAAEGDALTARLPFETARPELTDALCRRLLRAVPLPEHIIAHCEAVAAEAVRIAEALNATGLSLDVPLIRRSALLHDLARLENNHAETGARWLEALGYGAEAEIVRRHHDPDTDALNEANVVYLADKCVQEAVIVPLRERFETSKQKCRDSEALAAHERRRQQALRLAAAVNTQCDQEVIR